MYVFCIWLGLIDKTALPDTSWLTLISLLTLSDSDLKPVTSSFSLPIFKKITAHSSETQYTFTATGNSTLILT